MILSTSSTNYSNLNRMKKVFLLFTILIPNLLFAQKSEDPAGLFLKNQFVNFFFCKSLNKNKLLNT